MEKESPGALTPRKEKDDQKRSFRSFSDYLEEKARKECVPVHGQFELTPLCNFNCGMCYVHLTEAQMKSALLSPDQWKGLMTQARDAGMYTATLSGGECLTYPGFREIYEHLQDLGCRVELITNGALLDEGWVEYFVRRRPECIHVTLYGDSGEVYRRVTGRNAFETVVRHLKALREAELPLSLNVTPSRLLGEDVFGTMKLARELSPALIINEMLNDPREETGRSIEGMELDEEFYLRIKKYHKELAGVPLRPCPAGLLPEPGGPERTGTFPGLRCGAGRSGFNMTWDGAMIPCNELEKIRAYPLKVGFGEAWATIRREVDQLRRSRVCRGCAYLEVCENCVGRVARCAPPGEMPLALCKRTMRFVEEGVYSLTEDEKP